MKLQGRRKSKNIEVQTDKERDAAQYGRQLQNKVMGNESFLHDDTPISQWGDARDPSVKALTNPGRSQSNFPTTTNGAQKRRLKDPKPQDFEFFKHTTTSK